jgi:hypothetical protein
MTLSDIKKRMHDIDKNLDAEAFVTIFGPPKAGKTTLAAELAQGLAGGLPVLFCDANTSRLTLTQPQNAHLIENVRFIDLDKPDDMAFIANAFYSGDKDFQDFAVVVVDEASTVGKSILEAYIREKEGLGPTDTLREFEGRDYAPPTAMMRSWLQALKNTPDLHVILTAHEKLEVTKAEGDTRRDTFVRPSFWPTAFEEVNQPSQVIAHIDVRTSSKLGKPEYTRTVQSARTVDVMAGSRIALPVTASPEQWVDALVDYWYPAEQESE